MPDSEIREQVPPGNDPAQIILLSMAEAETKAWEALAGYKFWMFGYHAARWVNYNQLLPRQRRFRNPFAGLVKIGREYADGAQEKLPIMELDSFSQLTLFNEPEVAHPQKAAIQESSHSAETPAGASLP